MSHIFVSYASEDRDRIMPVVRALEATGWSVFWDRTIPVGETWQKIIGAEIEACRCMVVIWSASSINKEWVYEEASEGKRRGVLAPVLIDDIMPPMGFRSIQAAKLGGWDGKAESAEFDRLIKDISHMLGTPPLKIEQQKQQADLEAARRAEMEVTRAREQVAERVLGVQVSLPEGLESSFKAAEMSFQSLRKKAAEYDVFLSYTWADGDRPRQIAEALTKAGLQVWFDAAEINDFTSIIRAVTEGLAQSKALVAYYSKTYPLRRACQWELTVAFLAAQAQGHPRRRVLVVNPEEKADHIYPIELRDAQFRAPSTDGGPALHELVQSVVKHVAGIDGPLADIHPLSAPNWYGMTPVGYSHFVGRVKEMWEVHSLLHAGDVAQVSYTEPATGGIGRVSGLGGVGKSLLAEEYALHFGSAYPGGVFWLRAHGNDDAPTPMGPEQREAVRTDQVRQMTERLGIDTHGMTEEQIEGALARKIASADKPCLWVVDDVPNGLDSEALRRWFAPHALALTLITTRSGEYSSLIKGIDLSVLERNEAYQLLTSRRVPTDRDEEEQARLLTEDLGYHALALDVTASALVSSVAAKPFGDFRAKLARPDKDALVLAETLAEALPNGHEKSIAQTMLRSVRGLGTEGQDFLRLASMLAVAPIPASLVTAVFQEADKLSREDAEERASLAFKQVTSASLAEIAGEKQATDRLSCQWLTHGKWFQVRPPQMRAAVAS